MGDCLSPDDQEEGRRYEFGDILNTELTDDLMQTLERSRVYLPMTVRTPSAPDRESRARRGARTGADPRAAALGSIITFSRRAVIDTMIVRNRDAAATAEALARGGLRIATAVLIADRLTKNLAQAARTPAARREPRLRETRSTTCGTSCEATGS